MNRALSVAVAVLGCVLAVAPWAAQARAGGGAHAGGGHAAGAHVGGGGHAPVNRRADWTPVGVASCCFSEYDLPTFGQYSMPVYTQA